MDNVHASTRPGRASAAWWRHLLYTYSLSIPLHLKSHLPAFFSSYIRHENVLVIPHPAHTHSVDSIRILLNHQTSSHLFISPFTQLL